MFIAVAMRLSASAEHLVSFLNMYTSQRAGLSGTDWFEINHGVKQGRVLSPVLFCVFLVYLNVIQIFKESPSLCVLCMISFSLFDGL